MFTIREAANILGIDTQGATIAIQGFGNAGQYAATLGIELLGLKVVAVSDSKGGIYNPDGLDPDDVIKHKQETGSVINYPGTKPLTNEEILEVECDILAPSALENQITARNADRIRPKIVAELANGPTTLEGDDAFFKNGVYVLPDFLCNAGGVTVSYFEMVQNAYDYYWDLPTVHERLDAKMTTAYHAVHETAERFEIDMRTAAYVIAVDRVATAVRLRGWV